MNNMKRINNPDDLIEEEKAANRIIANLAGIPIIETSGDENHQIKPLSVKFEVRLSESGGDIVFINITQPDRHHPSLVYPTLTKALGKLPELKSAKLKPVHPDTAYNPESGVICIAYELPRGGADHLIHELSESFEHSPKTGWADKISQKTDMLPIPSKETGGWLEHITQLFQSPREKNPRL